MFVYHLRITLFHYDDLPV